MDSGHGCSGTIKDTSSVSDRVPTRLPNSIARNPLPAIAIRIRKKRQELLSDGGAVKHFAVRTNLWDWKPKWPLEWHREKAGKIEAAHEVAKSELAEAPVLPAPT
jgi:hypothetical protein